MINALKLIKRHWDSKFLLSRSILVVVASFAASIFSYLFQLISGRYFSVENYATLVSLFSVSGILNLVAAFLTNGIVKAVSEIKSIDYPNRLSILLFTILKVNLVISLIVFLLIWTFTKQIADYLNINDSHLILVFGLAVIAGIISSQFGPFLQGLQRFKAFSFYTVSTAFTKFLVAIVIIILGLTVTDIFWGLTFTTLLVTIIALLLLKKNIINKWKSFGKTDLSLLVKYSIGSIFAIAGLNLLQNNDVILVKHFFSPEQAGIYSSLAILGKIIFYAATPVGLVMLPVCAERYKNNDNVMKPFLGSLALSMLIAGLISLLYWLTPTLVIKALFGEKYLIAAEYLPLFSILMSSYAALTLVAWFLIAVSKFATGALTLLAALIQYVGIHFYHNNLYEVIYLSILATSVALILSAISIIKSQKTGSVVSSNSSYRVRKPVKSNKLPKTTG